MSVHTCTKLCHMIPPSHPDRLIGITDLHGFYEEEKKTEAHRTGAEAKIDSSTDTTPPPQHGEVS
jgi:hypothetical protein